MDKKNNEQIADKDLDKVVGGEGGAGFDFVQVNGSNTAGDDFSIDPNGTRVRK